MHPRTEELLQHLDSRRDELRRAVEAVPEALRSRRPGESRWSVAEIVEHLAIVERQIVALLRRGLRNAEASGPLPPARDTAPVLPTIDEKALLDRERRLQAGPAVRPTGASLDEAWASLERSREELRATLLAADGRATDSIRAPHPFFGELTFAQWHAFVGYHEARHAAQVRATAADLTR